MKRRWLIYTFLLLILGSYALIHWQKNEKIEATFTNILNKSTNIDQITVVYKNQEKMILSSAQHIQLFSEETPLVQFEKYEGPLKKPIAKTPELTATYYIGKGGLYTVNVYPLKKDIAIPEKLDAFIFLNDKKRYVAVIDESQSLLSQTSKLNALLTFAKENNPNN